LPAVPRASFSHEAKQSFFPEPLFFFPTPDGAEARPSLPANASFERMPTLPFHFLPLDDFQKNPFFRSDISDQIDGFLGGLGHPRSPLFSHSINVLPRKAQPKSSLFFSFPAVKHWLRSSSFFFGRSVSKAFFSFLRSSFLPGAK